MCRKHKFFGERACPQCKLETQQVALCKCGYYPADCNCKPVSNVLDSTEYQYTPRDKSFKLDTGKPRVGLVLREVPYAIEKLGTVLGFGAEKYSVGNWRGLEDINGRFLDSMMRHLVAYHKGEKVDPESGESHLAHAFFNLAILLEQEGRQ